MTTGLPGCPEEPLLWFNGLDGRQGSYLLPPVPARQLADSRPRRHGRPGAGPRAPGLGGPRRGQGAARAQGGPRSRQARRGRLGRDLRPLGGLRAAARGPRSAARPPAGTGREAAGTLLPRVRGRRRLPRGRDQGRVPRPPRRRSRTGRSGEGALLPPAGRRPGGDPLLVPVPARRPVRRRPPLLRRARRVPPLRRERGRGRDRRQRTAAGGPASSPPPTRATR